jgi:hypothetical protein
MEYVNPAPSVPTSSTTNCITVFKALFRISYTMFTHFNILSFFFEGVIRSEITRIYLTYEPIYYNSY